MPHSKTIRQKQPEGAFNTCNTSQRARILQYLRHKPLSTLQARKELDILSPAPRIFELRAQGFNIITEKVTEDSGKAKHRVALYVLLTGTATE